MGAKKLPPAKSPMRTTRGSAQRLPPVAQKSVSPPKKQSGKLAKANEKQAAKEPRGRSEKKVSKSAVVRTATEPEVERKTRTSRKRSASPPATKNVRSESKRDSTKEEQKDTKKRQTAAEDQGRE